VLTEKLAEMLRGRTFSGVHELAGFLTQQLLQRVEAEGKPALPPEEVAVLLQLTAQLEHWRLTPQQHQLLADLHLEAALLATSTTNAAVEAAAAGGSAAGTGAGAAASGAGQQDGGTQAGARPQRKRSLAAAAAATRGSGAAGAGSAAGGGGGGGYSWEMRASEHLGEADRHLRHVLEGLVLDSIPVTQCAELEGSQAAAEGAPGTDTASSTSSLAAAAGKAGAAGSSHAYPGASSSERLARQARLPVPGSLLAGLQQLPASPAASSSSGSTSTRTRAFGCGVLRTTPAGGGRMATLDILPAEPVQRPQAPNEEQVQAAAAAAAGATSQEEYVGLVHAAAERQASQLPGMLRYWWALARKAEQRNELHAAREAYGVCLRLCKAAERAASPAGVGQAAGAADGAPQAPPPLPQQQVPGVELDCVISAAAAALKLDVVATSLLLLSADEELSQGRGEELIARLAPYCLVPPGSSKRGCLRLAVPHAAPCCAGLLLWWDVPALFCSVSCRASRCPVDRTRAPTDYPCRSARLGQSTRQTNPLFLPPLSCPQACHPAATCKRCRCCTLPPASWQTPRSSRPRSAASAWLTWRPTWRCCSSCCRPLTSR
jgi:hypothetical protein